MLYPYYVSLNMSQPEQLLDHYVTRPIAINNSNDHLDIKLEKNNTPVHQQFTWSTCEMKWFAKEFRIFLCNFRWCL